MGDDKNTGLGLIGLITLVVFLGYLAWNQSRRRTTTVKETKDGYVIVEN